MAHFFALCAIALWSTNAVTANFVLKTLAVEQVQFLQFLGAFIVFVLLRASSGTGASPRRGFNRPAWLLGCIGLAGTMIFQYIAFSIGPITEVNIIAYTWPLIAAIMVIAAGDAQRPAFLFVLAVIGFIGAALVIGGSTITQMTFQTSLYGFAAALVSALCMAAFSFGIGRTKTDANDVLLPGAIVGLVITSVWCFAGTSSWTDPIALLCGFYLGAGPMGLGYLFWSLAMQKDQTDQVAILGFLTPITSTGLLLFNGQSLEISSLIGAAIVFACCAWIGLQARYPKNA